MKLQNNIAFQLPTYSGQISQTKQNKAVAQVEKLATILLGESITGEHRQA